MNKDQPIVSILGNSVPLLIQPPRKDSSEKTYGEHLRDAGFSVVNKSKQAVMISDLYQYMEDECISYFPDFIIMHFGIVESTHRARTRYIHSLFSFNAWNNSIINQQFGGFFMRSFATILKKLYKILIEKPLVSIGITYRWLSPKRFEFIVKDVTKRFFMDTPVKKIIFVGMTPVSEWVEKKARGTNKSIAEYNAIMSRAARTYANVIYIDLAEIIPNKEDAGSSPDGIHLTAKGHKLLADALASHLQGGRSDFSQWKQINTFDHYQTYRLYEHWNKRNVSRVK